MTLVHTGIDKSFNRHPVDPTVYVQHRNRPESLWIVLHGRLHVGLDILLTYLLGDQPLRLRVERVRVHHPQSLLFPLLPGLHLLAQHRRKRLYKNTPF